MKLTSSSSLLAAVLLVAFTAALPGVDGPANALIARDAIPIDANPMDLAEAADGSDAADAASDAESGSDGSLAGDTLGLDDDKCQIQAPKGRNSCQANLCRLASQVGCRMKNKRCAGTNLRGRNAPIACKDCKCVRVGS